MSQTLSPLSCPCSPLTVWPGSKRTLLYQQYHTQVTMEWLKRGPYHVNSTYCRYHLTKIGNSYKRKGALGPHYYYYPHPNLQKQSQHAVTRKRGSHVSSTGCMHTGKKDTVGFISFSVVLVTMGTHQSACEIHNN